MICIEDFSISKGFFTINFQKSEEYTINEVNGVKYISVGIFIVPLEKVIDKFKEM